MNERAKTGYEVEKDPGGLFFQKDAWYWKKLREKWGITAFGQWEKRMFAAGEGETDAERWSTGDVGAWGRAEQGVRSAVQAGRFGEGNWTPVPHRPGGEPGRKEKCWKQKGNIVTWKEVREPPGHACDGLSEITSGGQESWVSQAGHENLKQPLADH